MKKSRPFTNKRVQCVFEAYPVAVRGKLMGIRELIFEVASERNEVGPLEETLKWGEPSYLTFKTKSGTTIRLGWKESRPDVYAIYFNCRTSLKDTIKAIYGDTFEYEGNRALLLSVKKKIPEREISDCIAMALTYHLNKVP